MTNFMRPGSAVDEADELEEPMDAEVLLKASSILPRFFVFFLNKIQF